MPITQREADIMQADAEVKVKRMVEEWRTNFLQGRLPQGDAPLAAEEEQEVSLVEEQIDAAAPPAQGVPAVQGGEEELPPEVQQGPY
jgi:hypothetical protein